MTPQGVAVECNEDNVLQLCRDFLQLGIRIRSGNGLMIIEISIVKMDACLKQCLTIIWVQFCQLKAALR
jgi:hypothetical protein